MVGDSNVLVWKIITHIHSETLPAVPCQSDQSCAQQHHRSGLAGTGTWPVRREAMSSDRELARRLDVLEKKYASHDVLIRGIFDAIRSLMNPPTKPRRRIGF